jgi:hypothetical protein
MVERWSPSPMMHFLGGAAAENPTDKAHRANVAEQNDLLRVLVFANAVSSVVDMRAWRENRLLFLRLLHKQQLIGPRQLANLNGSQRLVVHKWFSRFSLENAIPCTPCTYSTSDEVRWLLSEDGENRVTVCLDGLQARGGSLAPHSRFGPLARCIRVRGVRDAGVLRALAWYLESGFLRRGLNTRNLLELLDVACVLSIDGLTDIMAYAVAESFESFNPSSNWEGFTTPPQPELRRLGDALEIAQTHGVVALTEWIVHYVTTFGKRAVVFVHLQAERTLRVRLTQTSRKRKRSE